MSILIQKAAAIRMLMGFHMPPRPDVLTRLEERGKLTPTRDPVHKFA